MKCSSDLWWQFQKKHRKDIFFALGENSPSSGPETASLALCLFITDKFQGRRVGGSRGGGADKATSFGQCSALSGQTAVWFPVSSSGITVSDDKLGLRKGQIRLENENAGAKTKWKQNKKKPHQNPPLLPHSKINFD